MFLLKEKRLFRLARFVENRIQYTTGCFISSKAEVPLSTKFPHPTGIVIGEGVRVGEQVRIYQNVTIGGARIGDAQDGNYPTIGERSVIFSNVVVIGSINIGKNCIIGANSVVTSDIPDNSTAVGAPAKCITKQLK